MQDETKLYLLCRVSIGVLFLIVLRTSFVPDEYYQAYEPAFRIVYPDTSINLHVSYYLLV